MLLIAPLVGGILGALGAAANRIKTRDEFLLWVIGGAIGGVLAVLGWTAIIWPLFEVESSVVIGLILFGTAGLLGAVDTRCGGLDPVRLLHPGRTVPDNLARHESMHSRTVAAIGELGFYVSYVTIGAIWGSAQGGSWNNLNAAGCGNPFEKTAHTFTD